MLEQNFLGNDIKTWLVAFSYILGAALLGRTTYWLCTKYFKVWASKTKTNLDYIFIDMVEEPVFLAIVLTGSFYGVETLTLPEGFSKLIENVFYIATLFNMAWFFTRLMDALVEHYVVPMVKQSKSGLDDHLLKITRKMVNVVIWIMAAIIGADNAGYDIGTVLAGLGVGGMAFALAAKDTISNVFGGVTIFVDKPFKVNDRIIIKDKEGFVEEIGFRSTKIRTLEGRIVYIPNKSVADDIIVNISKESSRRIKSYLSITYDTSHEKVTEALKIMKDVIADNQETESYCLASFEVFNAYSLDLLFVYYIKKKEVTNVLVAEVQSKVNLEILRRFNNAGISFAFPTQTIEINRVVENELSNSKKIA